MFTDKLDRFAVPTMVIWGSKDKYLPAKHANQAVEKIPVCQLKVFPNQGHNVYRNVGLFTQALAGFLA